ncbi:MAG: prolyl oligopeptidase family serine peptidase [Ignavibacteriales bacterium]|nr:prolyl oligopeptidase family serine peptidase [Ignavibacteriales bacterium]
MTRLLTLATLALVATTFAQKLDYPDARRGDVADDYHGTEVADPYRWLEDVDSEETREWIEAEVALTESYLSEIPFRDDLRKRFEELWDYEKFSLPSKHGDYFLFSKNDGLQEHSVVYIQKGEEGEPEVLIDPNLFSEDGSVSLKGTYVSREQKYVGYAISRGGSDWREFYVLDLDSRELLDDHIEWSKWSGMTWWKDGFFYGGYDEPNEEEKLKATNENHKIYYHKIGDDQSEDALIYENPERPRGIVYAQVTDDERYLILYEIGVESRDPLLYYKDLEADSEIKPIVDVQEAQYSVVESVGDRLLVLTNFGAPNYRVVSIDPAHPQKTNWVEIVPESRNKIQDATLVGGGLIVTYLKDAASLVTVFTPEGERLHDVELPGVGTAYGFGGDKDDEEVFYGFSSFSFPAEYYRYNVMKNESELFRRSQVDFNPEDFVTEQVFVRSKDGTAVPMFLVHKKDLKKDGKRPTLLTAYGGFNIALTPRFRLSIIPFLENDGVWIMANLRGGSEYGESWHEQGMLDNKQNVFDDFIACAEYMIDAGWTKPERLGIHGGSNGGLLVAATALQRPDLFGVAVPEVGVLDMLRYHKFTIGWAWVAEYGSSENPDQFAFLYEYSPLHNVESGVDYPSTLITTADHDDRVFPAHSFKFAAEMQHKHTGENPILIRIETQVGHGAGNTSKVIDELADVYSFILHEMDAPVKNYSKSAIDAPKKPEDLAANVAGVPSKAFVSWKFDPRDNEETDYRVYKSRGETVEIDDANFVGRTDRGYFVDRNVVEGATYIYRVVAVEDEKTSEPSDVATLTVEPLAEGKPDANVLYISRSPKYPRVEYEYVPNMYNPRETEASKARKHYPDEGELMTYTAIARNSGAGDLGAVEVVWTIDGEEVKRERFEELDPWETRATSVQLPWSAENPSIIKCEATPVDPTDEITENNNAVEIRSNALSYHFYVEESMRAFFESHKNGMGSYNFADWGQYHVALMNDMFADAKYEGISPNGVEERVFLDTVIYAPDDADEFLIKGFNHTPQANILCDGQWGFKSDGVHYHRDYTFKEENKVDWAILHELGHQLGLIDLYWQDIPRDRFHVVEPLTGETPPVADPDEGIIYYSSRKDALMKSVGHHVSDHSAGGLMRELSKRRGFFGIYLVDVPEENVLVFTDADGAPIANADVWIYHQDELVIPNVVKFKGKTDDEGRFVIPKRTTDEYEGGMDAKNVFSTTKSEDPNIVGMNATLFFRVKQGDRVGYAFTDICDFNVAYWRGDVERAEYEIVIDKFHDFGDAGK